MNNAIKIGTLRNRTLKLIQKHTDGSSDTLYFADPGTELFWTGETNASFREHYRDFLLWCYIETGEQVGLTIDEIVFEQGFKELLEAGREAGRA